MTENQNWSQRYEKLLREHEEHIAVQERRETSLGRLIMRLSMVAKGYDENLDPLLNRIHKAVRTGVSQTSLEHVETLSDGLLHIPEPTGGAPSVIEPGLRKLIPKLKLKAEDAEEATRLLLLLSRTSNDVSEDDLERLASILRGGESPRQSQAGSGLFHRLFGSHTERDASAGDQPPNQIVLNLLARARWPVHWENPINEMRQRLSDHVSSDEWIAVLQDLLKLSSESYSKAEEEIKEAEDFLGNLTRRLQDLDEHLREVHDQRGELTDKSRQLTDDMFSHMNGIEASVEGATDLQTLKQEISWRMNDINGLLNGFLEEEQAFYTQADASEGDLRERLKQLEQESEDLRYRMLEARHLALLDALTQLPNRMAYDERIVHEYARWRRFGESLVIQVWDVDDFKQLNDRFGHKAGDKALYVIGQCLKKRLRETDFIARYGGEEFVALLCGANKKEALAVADEMRVSVMESGFHSSGKAVPVSISCGLAMFEEGDTTESVFERADRALYRAKQQGKNCCELG
jgi:diguanylate cyclase